jgi:hypothetical protein
VIAKKNIAPKSQLVRGNPDCPKIFYKTLNANDENIKLFYSLLVGQRLAVAGGYPA